MGFIDTLSITASGLTAERVRLQAVASNLANARTTRGVDGGPYVRQLPLIESVGRDFGTELERNLAWAQVTEVANATDPFELVYDPTHPHADDQGYVKYPNVNILNEMVDMMTTARTYEANVNAVETTKQMAHTAISIGRG
jgi:flagellar basal-body rod protein FlgC